MKDLDAADGIQYFKQTADIDLTGQKWTPFKFGGHFDGNGKTISNVTINLPNNEYVGFFSELSTGGELTGIKLENVDVKGNARVGGLVGYSLGNISNSYASGSVIGSDYYIGGLVGSAGGSIFNSYASGSVTGTGESSYSVGGLVGFAFGSISNSYASGNVTGEGLSSNSVGGLVGATNFNGKISNSYASGSVSGDSKVGGLVGYAYSITKISSSYYDRETTNQSDDVGKGIPRTTDEMKKGKPSESIYTDWDSAIWNFGDDTDYPTLK